MTKEVKDRTYYSAASINPWNNDPARRYSHTTKECPLLKHWDGNVMEAKVRHPKNICPFCSNKRILKKLEKAYRAYLHLEPYIFYNYLLAYLEGQKTKRALEKEMELM